MAQQSNILNVIKAHHLRDAAGIIAGLDTTPIEHGQNFPVGMEAHITHAHCRTRQEDRRDQSA